MSHGHSSKLNVAINPHMLTIVLMYTMSDSSLHIQSRCWRTHTHTHNHGAMLSPNVINAVKRLTSAYLFKSRHQTHSFFFFICTDHRSYCQGRKAPSDRLSGQRSRPNKARAFSTTLSLSFIIYRGSVPRQRRPPPEQGRSLSCGQWTVELEVAVDSLRRMMSPTSDQDTARHQAGGQRVKSEGRRQNGNSVTSGLRGWGAQMKNVCLWYSWNKYTLEAKYVQ